MKQDILSKLDDYFEQKKPSEAAIMFFGCAALVAFLIYLFAFEPSEYFRNSETEAHNKVTTELKRTNDYLDQVSSPDKSDRNFKIAQESATLANLVAKRDSMIKLNSYFDQKLKELSFLLFDERNWANFLDSVVKLAKENDIKILQLKNDIKAPSHQKIEQVLNINVTFLGSFQNVLKYINSLEESKLVVDMHKMDINTTGSGLGADLNISVWGMRY